MMEPPLDLTALRLFLAILETGSLSSAARRLGRTQSAASQRIAALEERLGRKLFHRERQRLRLTRFGEGFVEPCRKLLAHHDRLVERLSMREMQGRVRFGTPDLYAAYLLPAALARFNRSYPAVELELRCARSDRLCEAVAREELDLALVTSHPGRMRGRIVRREPLVWVTGKDAPEPGPRTLPLALLPEDAAYHRLAIEALERAGQPWRIVCVSESIAGLQAAVFAGLACAVVPRAAVVAGMRIVEAGSLPPLPAVELALISPAPGTPPVSRLATVLREGLSDSSR